MKIYRRIYKRYTKKALDRFLEEIFEIAFGEDAINKDYSMKEVVKRIKEVDALAWKYEKAEK